MSAKKAGVLFFKRFQHQISGNKKALPVRQNGNAFDFLITLFIITFTYTYLYSKGTCKLPD